MRADEQITIALVELLSWDSRVDGSGIAIDVKEEIVTLKGNVCVFT
ncbi:MAG: hypothetical protein ACE5OP_11550 [Candidatus Glassbacteria bacterium]